MSSPSPSAQQPSFANGQVATFAIFLVVAVCIGLIGLSGYVKYEMDRAQAEFAAPETQFNSEQQGIDRIRRQLGYSGFLGYAQTFVNTREATILQDMKAQLKMAGDSLERLPEKTPADLRRDFQTILGTFTTAMQKAEKSTDTPPGAEFSNEELTSLYAALPVLDSRVNAIIAINRLAGQSKVQFWATMLTIMCWASLIIASALAVGIYLVLRDRNSAPMRALAQSVKNMARGDMRTTIWGMERQDAIGELARAVDQARFHFSQLPDMSLLSEQGPVRIRFEGNTRSLFEAMMRVISSDSEQVHQQAAILTQAVVKQQDTLSHVIERVEAVLQSVEKRAVHGDQQVRQALQNMLGSAESLKNAQEHAADQLNRIIPFLQERTQGLSEITQITGKQVAQVLQSLAQTERGLRTSAVSSEEAIRKFSSTADTLGERMFGAVNLLQASGKVLAETSEATKSRFDEAIERIGSATMPQVDTANPATERLEASVSSLEAAFVKLETLLAEQHETARVHIDLLSTHSSGLLTQTSATAQTLSTAADRMRDEHEKLGEMIAKLNVDNQGPAEPAYVEPLLADIHEGFKAIEQSISVLQDQITAQQADPTLMQSEEQMREHWYQMAAQIEASRSNLAQVVTEQAHRIEEQFDKLSGGSSGGDAESVRELHGQMEQQAQILNELVATLGLLDSHMQELRTQVASVRQRA
jgi:HAMP domain-containing protein/ABC-type transporter Mla subunit MlaD